MLVQRLSSSARKRGMALQAVNASQVEGSGCANLSVEVADYNISSVIPRPTTKAKVQLISRYTLIFLLSVFGNLIIIVVLMLNKRMRTVTNSFLLSLAVSDLMMALFCIPLTLIPNILGDFIFGGAMWRISSYFIGESHCANHDLLDFGHT